jgi:hypothetical protein
MLQQEQTEPQNTQISGSPSAAQTRVTPQELAEAVAKMEARREAELQQCAETITIGEALHTLGISASEEEMLTEVETLRRQRARAAQQANYARICRRVYFSLFALAAFLIISILGAVNLRLRHRLAEATQSSTPLPIQTLSAVPEGVAVHISSASLSDLATGLTQEGDVSVDTRVSPNETHASMFNNEWTLLKSGGALFVRAWTTADMALRAANGNATVVFSNRAAWLPAENVVPVQLPLYRFYDLDIDSFTAKGEKATAATSVLEAATLKGADETTTALVQHYLDTKDPDLRTSYWDEQSGQWRSETLTVESTGHQIRLTGHNRKAAKKLLATRLTQEVVNQLHIPAQVSNEMEVKSVPSDAN